MLFLLAGFYFRERIFADGAYYLVQLVNRGTFAIEHGRFISMLSQVWPLLAVKLGLPLRAVLMAYSLGDVLYYYLVFLSVLYILKDKEGALLIILLLTVGIMYTFYCPVTELLQGLALLVLFDSLLKSTYRSSLPGKALLLVLMVTVLYSHPLSFIVFFFLVGFRLIRKDIGPGKNMVNLILVAIMTVILKLKGLDDYDASKIQYHTDPHTHAYKQLFSLTYMKEFLPFFLKEYWMVVCAALFTLSWYIREKQYSKALYTSLAAGGYVALMVCTHYAPYLSNYSERMYLPVVPIVFIPLVLDLLREAGPGLRRGILAVLFIFIFIRIGIIYTFGKVYEHRVSVLRQMMSSLPDVSRRFVWSQESADVSGIEAGWSVPCETLLLSSLEGKKNTKVFYISTDWNLYKQGKNKNKYIGKRDSIVNDTVVNPLYFSPLGDAVLFIDSLPSTHGNIGKR